MAQLSSLGHVATLSVNPQHTKNMTNEQIADHLKKIGSHIVELEQHLLEVAFAEAKLYEMIAVRMPGVSPAETTALTLATRKALENGMTRKRIAADFQKSVEAFSRL